VSALAREDEAGHIVRPPETAGSTDHFRRMDPVTRTMSADDQAARAAARSAYFDAVRGWVRTGRHALDAGTARERLPVITADMALADAYFRLGVWLRRHGQADDADPFLTEASRLHPALGICGVRLRILARSAKRPVQSFGHACMHSAIGNTIRRRT
jgi:hypothetical protein